MRFHPARYITALGVASFLTGFSLMAYELVAARLLAPTLGSSIYVWTSVIGIIIAALSLGYWFGGKVADARQNPIDIVYLCLLSAFTAVITLFAYASVLDWVANAVRDVRLQGVVASLLLFAPTSFILGCTSPYLAKLNIKTLKTAGESVANLSALNSIGGIVGTFMTGFVLFSYIGSSETILVVVLCLVASSWLLVPKKYVLMRIIASIILVALPCITIFTPTQHVAQIDTPSAHYTVNRFTYKGEEIFGLTTGPGGIQSAVYTNGNPELVFWYTNFATKVIEAERPQDVLILGGGAFTVPQALARNLPEATIDAVEIDPALERISKEYFNYKDHKNINLIFQDARAYVNTAEKTYDAIFVDVFGDNTTPFSILTKEYGQQIQRILKQNGIVVINAIGSLNGSCSGLMNAIDATYRPYLPNGYWATESNKQIKRGNHILVFSARQPAAVQSLNVLPTPTSSLLYTDNFMPAEKLHFQCQHGL